MTPSEKRLPCLSNKTSSDFFRFDSVFLYTEPALLHEEGLRTGETW